MFYFVFLAFLGLNLQSAYAQNFQNLDAQIQRTNEREAAEREVFYQKRREDLAALLPDFSNLPMDPSYAKDLSLSRSPLGPLAFYEGLLNQALRLEGLEVKSADFQKRKEALMRHVSETGELLDRDPNFRQSFLERLEGLQNVLESGHASNADQLRAQASFRRLVSNINDRLGDNTSAEADARIPVESIEGTIRGFSDSVSESSSTGAQLKASALLAFNSIPASPAISSNGSFGSTEDRPFRSPTGLLTQKDLEIARPVVGGTSGARQEEAKSPEMKAPESPYVSERQIAAQKAKSESTVLSPSTKPGGFLEAGVSNDSPVTPIKNEESGLSGFASGIEKVLSKRTSSSSGDDVSKVEAENTADLASLGTRHLSTTSEQSSGGHHGGDSNSSHGAATQTTPVPAQSSSSIKSEASASTESSVAPSPESTASEVSSPTMVAAVSPPSTEVVRAPATSSVVTPQQTNLPPSKVEMPVAALTPVFPANEPFKLLSVDALGGPDRIYGNVGLEPWSPMLKPCKELSADVVRESVQQNIPDVKDPPLNFFLHRFYGKRIGGSEADLEALLARTVQLVDQSPMAEAVCRNIKTPMARLEMLNAFMTALEEKVREKFQVPMHGGCSAFEQATSVDAKTAYEDLIELHFRFLAREASLREVDLRKTDKAGNKNRPHVINATLFPEKVESIGNGFFHQLTQCAPMARVLWQKELKLRSKLTSVTRGDDPSCAPTFEFRLMDDGNMLARGRMEDYQQALSNTPGLSTNDKKVEELADRLSSYPRNSGGLFSSVDRKFTSFYSGAERYYAPTIRDQMTASFDNENCSADKAYLRRQHQLLVHMAALPGSKAFELIDEKFAPNVRKQQH